MATPTGLATRKGEMEKSFQVFPRNYASFLFLKEILMLVSSPPPFPATSVQEQANWYPPKKGGKLRKYRAVTDINGNFVGTMWEGAGGEMTKCN